MPDIDIGQLSEAINDKADRDLNNMNPSTLVKETIVRLGMPDYSNGFDGDVTGTADQDYIGYARATNQSQNTTKVEIDGQEVFFSRMTDSYRCNAGGQFFVPKGSSWSRTGTFDFFRLYPLKY